MVNGVKVSAKEKLAYGIGDFALNVCYTAINFYLLFFLVSAASIRVEVAGTIYLVVRIWGAFSDYLMGNISDRTNSRLGKRKVYLLFGGLPLGITFFLMWLVPFESEFALTIYYYGIAIIFSAAYSLVAVPYAAMTPEISQDYNERLSISGYRMGLSFLGNLVAAAGVAVIVDLIFPGKEAYKQSYPVMGAAFGLIIPICVCITFFGTKTRVASAVDLSKGFIETMINSLKEILKLKEFRYILGMFIFNMIALDLIGAVLIFFLKDVIKLPEGYTYAIMAIPLVVAFLAAPLWVYIGSKGGKQLGYIIGAVYFAVMLLFALVVPEGSLNIVLGFAVFAGIGISASQVLPWSIIPDVIEVDEYEHGVRREGTFYGTTTFLYKCASAVTISSSMLFLGRLGYVEASTGGQPESAILGIRLLMGVFPGVLFLISAWFVKNMPIDKARFDEILRILEERRGVKGKE